MGIITGIGLSAAFLTTVCQIPQLAKSWKSKHTGDVSLWMYVMLNTGVLLWLTYGLLITNWPIIIANSITIIFTLSILFMKLKYK